MRVAREEIFGPVLSVIRWSDVDEVIAAANSVEYGLTAAVWTRDITTAMRTAQRLQSGYVWINGVNAHVRAMPYGGYKNSGVGRERGSGRTLFLHGREIDPHHAVIIIISSSGARRNALS